MPGWQAAEVLLEPSLVELDLSSFCCFQCLNSPEPLGRRFIGGAKMIHHALFLELMDHEKRFLLLTEAGLPLGLNLMDFC